MAAETTIPTDYAGIMAQLAAWGTEKVRAMNTRNGVQGDQFGCMLGPVRGLAKALKTDHALGLALWKSGNHDARILATMLLSSKKLPIADAEAMVRSLDYPYMVDELVYRVIANAPYREELRKRWMDSPEPLVRRAGWALGVVSVKDGTIPDADIPPLLDRITTEVKGAPPDPQWTINHCLVEIGISRPAFRPAAIAIGERFGRLDDRPVPKGCTSSYAPDWIAAVLRRTEGKK